MDGSGPEDADGPLNSFTQAITSLPFKRYRRNPYFYLQYDALYGAIFLLAVAWMASIGFEGVLPEPTVWGFALFPVLLYLQVLGHVFVHNATHRAWPRPINRLVGELAGVFVVTRFASWEIIHQRHHVHSDDRVMDPHPVEPSFFRYSLRTVVRVEQHLQAIYAEQFGDTPQNRRREKFRAVGSAVTAAILLYAYYLFWGPFGFFALFLPAAVLAGLFVSHFNWSTHNGFSKTQDYGPVNLDHGWYWWGNRLLFGIYFHANHHRRPGLFNPRRMPADHAPR